MRYFLAMLPILVVLGLMIRLRWGAHQAGPAGWLAGLVLAAVWFGLTPQAFWVSQAKGLLLSVFVLGVMWPALFLYHWIDQNDGIAAVARWLEGTIPNRGMCLILLAWALSGLLEGLAGFGLPIAVVAPMLAALGVPPLTAVAAVAVGHSWAVTFGDMGVILQTLSAVVGLDSAQLVPWAALLLGLACLLCGLLAAFILGELRQWPKVALLAVVMAATQYGLADAGLIPLSAFGAGLAGMLVYLLGARLRAQSPGTREPGFEDSAQATLFGSHAVLLPVGSGAPLPWNDDGLRKPVPNLNPIRNLLQEPPEITTKITNSRRPAILAIATYGALTLLMAALTMLAPLRTTAQRIAWKPQFPEVVTRIHSVTPAGPGQVFRPFSHPGALILLVSCASIALSCGGGIGRLSAAKKAAGATWRSAGAATVGIVSMVGLSTLMDHCGMSYLLAQGLSRLLGASYPLVSPCVGILGAFATGSNNNSNVLFGSLQKNVALLLHINPCLLVAAQTAGGALGSMLAPAKIIVGCSTVGQVGREGLVLRRTVPYGLGIGLVVGMLAWLFSRL